MLDSNLVFLPVLFISLFIAVFVTNKIIKVNLPNVKYVEIDGLRGFLAFLVFLHHSFIWSVFIKTNKWEAPNSNLFNQFGQTSVVLFFMITAFLFTTKLINVQNNSIDWKKYIKSRFFRLFPAYILSIIVMFFIVLILSNFQNNDSISSNIKTVLSWIFFTINGPNDINNIKNTYLIDAGVTWSLPYEWLFYLILPVIGLFFKVKTNIKSLIVFIVVFTTIAFLNHVALKHFIPFLGGIVTALIVNKKKIAFDHKKYSFLILLLIAFQIYFFNTGTTIFPIIITTIVFILIASGNSIFGILSNTFSRLFGQITYSLYLLHGIVLFIVFRFIIGYHKAAQFSDIKYWTIIVCCVFPIVFISQLSYKYIELTFINLFKTK